MATVCTIGLGKLCQHYFEHNMISQTSRWWFKCCNIADM